MDWEKEAARQRARADQLQEDLTKCLSVIKRQRECFKAIEHQCFVAQGVFEQAKGKGDGLDRYRHTYP